MKKIVELDENVFNDIINIIKNRIDFENDLAEMVKDGEVGFKIIDGVKSYFLTEKGITNYNKDLENKK